MCLVCADKNNIDFCELCIVTYKEIFQLKPVFLFMWYRLAMAHEDIANNLNCRVLAIKQPHPLPLRKKTNLVPALDSSTNMDFSQIEIAGLL